jgi:hypothetical protein
MEMKIKSKAKKKLEKVLSKFPNTVNINYVYKYPKIEGGANLAWTPDQKDGRVSKLEQGINIGWSKRGMGFGSILIYQKNGELFLDTESMGKEFALFVLAGLIQKAKLVS